MVGGCGQLKFGLGLGVAVHGLIGLGLWLWVPKPHFAHPYLCVKLPRLNSAYIFVFSNLNCFCISLAVLNHFWERIVSISGRFYVQLI